MNRIYKDAIVPKYKTGCFSWDEGQQEIVYHSLVNEQSAVPQINTNGFLFKLTMNQMEETIFAQEFCRTAITHDSDFIVLEDIKNIVLFLAPKELLTNKFINFLHTENFDRIVKGLIMYFEYFLRLVEFILVRRDEKAGKQAQIESLDSIQMKRIYSEYLLQYRIIIAKEYSLVVLGLGEMAKCYHLIPVVNISMRVLDMSFHESFLAVCTQMVWIAHHRRAYDVIDNEISRLFRSQHFELHRNSKVTFEKHEQDLLYGRHNYRSNFRQQNSPLILELKHIERRNLPILWLGKKKYRGNDLRIQQLEMEVIISDSQLHLANLAHGILGHPKLLYNTILELDSHKLREMGYSTEYDPYNLVTQPCLHSPDLDIIARQFKHFDAYFEIKQKPTEFNKELIRKWKKRDEHYEHVLKDQLFVNVIARCRQEIDTIGKADKRMSARAITRFYQITKKLRKA